MSVKITDTDNGYRELMMNVRKWRGKTIRIGVNDEPHEGSDGMTNSDIGLIHELGLGNVPQRSFLRAWIDQNQKDWMSWLSRGVLASLLEGRQWASNFGRYAVREVREKIRRGIPPELKKETIKRKASKNPTPLIDTEQLINAIDYEIPENER